MVEILSIYPSPPRHLVLSNTNRLYSGHENGDILCWDATGDFRKVVSLSERVRYFTIQGPWMFLLQNNQCIRCHDMTVCCLFDLVCCTSQATHLCHAQKKQDFFEIHLDANIHYMKLFNDILFVASDDRKMHVYDMSVRCLSFF